MFNYLIINMKITKLSYRTPFVIMVWTLVYLRGSDEWIRHNFFLYVLFSLVLLRCEESERRNYQEEFHLLAKLSDWLMLWRWWFLIMSCPLLSMEKKFDRALSHCYIKAIFSHWKVFTTIRTEDLDIYLFKYLDSVYVHGSFKKRFFSQTFRMEFEQYVYVCSTSGTQI